LKFLLQGTNRLEVFGGVQAFRGKIKLEAEPNLSPYVVFFDLLALNGENTMRSTLSSRLKSLAEILTLDNYCSLPRTNTFSIPLEKSDWSLKTFLGLKSMFLDVIKNGGEGLMIKGSDGIYEAGDRDQWMKLKPDFLLGNGDSHEYAVVGAGWDPTLNYAKVDFGDCHGMNTFFIGCLTNKEDMLLHNVVPEVLICFTIQNGFSRNDLISFSERMYSQLVPIEQSLHFSAFKWTKSKQISHKMLYLFSSPATFTIQSSSFEWKKNFWIARHPRLVRECTLDRPWKEHSITFKEMQLLGNSSRKPSSSEINDLGNVISGLDEEYLKSGVIVKDVRPASKIDPENSRLYFESRNELARSATVFIEYEPSELESPPINLRTTWFSTANIPKSSELYHQTIASIYSLLVAAGWNCDGNNCQIQHQEIAVFSIQCEADGVCKEVELLMERRLKSAICIRSKPLYILDAAFLAIARPECNSRFILAQ
jgi:ATP dependent DNA ligase domain